MTTTSIPALLEPIQKRLNDALTHQTLEPSDYADMAWTTMPDTARLLAAVKAVTEMHRREVIAVHEGHGEEATCTECGHYWPCPTVSAVEAALRSEA